MKINIFKFCVRLSLLLILFSLGSCKKFLDKKSDTSLVVPTTLDQLRALMDDYFLTNDLRSPSLMNGSSDEYFITQASFDSRVTTDQDYYLWRFHSIANEKDIIAVYYSVYNFNTVLDQIQKIEISNSNIQQWKEVKGSALFYRSYYYLLLLWEYGKAYDPSTSKTDLGIIYRTHSDYNIPAVRTSVANCYEQIIADTKESISELPTYSSYTSRPTKAAAYGLLARTYLSMRDYTNAYLYADSSLQLKSDLMDYNGDPDILGLDAALPFKQFNKETIFYSELNGAYALPNITRGRIDTVLYQSYADNDLRKTAFFAPKEGYYYFKGTYAQQTYKFFNGLATDEMYLIRAECLARQGKINEAMADLNTLLIKRYKTGEFNPLTASSKDDALQKVLMERRKELILRGFRWIDVKRLNKEGANIILTRKMNGQTYTLQPGDPYYAFPFPEDLLQLTGVPQN